MAAVYGSNTFDNALSKGNGKSAQDMIGTTPALRANSDFMQNGHIGAGQDQQVSPPERAAQIAAQDTPAIGHLGDDLLWDIPTGTWGVAPAPAPPPPP